MRRPDRLVFDLETTGQAGFDDVRDAGLALRDILEQVGLVPFVTTMAPSGMHVQVPLEPVADFETVRAFAGDVLQVLSDRKPEVTTRPNRGLVLVSAKPASAREPRDDLDRHRRELIGPREALDRLRSS